MRNLEASREVVVLSGPIAVGKSTLAEGLRRTGGARVLSTRVVLSRLSGISAGRDRLIATGDEIDRETSGRWIAEALTELSASESEAAGRPVLLVVDAVRRSMQVDWIRERFGRVLHVHLDADEATLANRYATRREALAFADARTGETERAVADLATSADLVVDTVSSSPVRVLRRICDRLATDRCSG